ncbi:MAG: FHA domain-containing serine/threonine-protein kinase [Pyrinomonadaceae bacterium]
MSTNPLQLVAGGRVPVAVNGIAELQLLEYLGGGGFGSVWKTVDTAQGTLYTLKVMQDLDEKGIDVARVLLEAEVSIASDYVVPVVGLREWSPYTFLIIFDYFAARSLDQRLREGALGDAQKRVIFDQILYGVSDAHYNNIIHRDLKPANVLVSDDLRVKLIDFGISKFKDRNITQAGHTFGTPYYMAPELLIHGSSVADAASDIYALGQLLYELVMGKCLWLRKGWRRIEDFIAFLRSDPPPAEVMDFDGFTCDFYPNAQAVLRRMVKIDPAERFSSVEEIIREVGIEPKPAPEPVSVYDFPVLIIESGTNRNARTFLHIDDGETAVMGRADFAGNDQSISRRHIEIRRQGRRYWLRDLASRNGTMVGGSQLALGVPCELRHADRIKIGDIFLRFAFMQQP